MPLALDHLIIPARDRNASAEKLASILGVRWGPAAIGPFTEVYLSDSCTLDFDQQPEPIHAGHYCFRVSEAEFDAILGRLRAMGIAFRSGPHGPDDGQINTAFGGRLVYWSEPDGHAWEILTQSYTRPPAD